MYRPLYWFGNGASPTLNTSLARQRRRSTTATTVTITMKGWKWSNGEPVTAQNVLFWIHMLQAVGAQRLGRFRARRLFPTNISDVKAASATDADHDDEQAVQHDLVHLQRAEPDHPDAGGLGPDRLRAQRLRRGRGRLRQGVQLPEQPVQGPVHLGQLADLGGRGRAVEADRLQLRRQRHLRAEPGLLRPGQADPGQVRGGAVHHRQRGVQRAAGRRGRRPEARLRLPAPHGRAEQARQCRRRPEPGQRLHARPAVSSGRSTTSR